MNRQKGSGSWTVAVFASWLLMVGGCPTPPPPNQAPTADAGNDQTVNGGVEVVLDGSGSSDPDGDDLSYAWLQTAGPDVTLSDSETSTATFAAPNIATTLRFALEVTDTSGGSDIDTVNINVEPSDNLPPVVDAGLDRTVDGSVTVVLQATVSDPDGDPLSYSWTQTAGAMVTLSGADTSAATFVTVNADDVLTFELTVNDGNGHIVMDTVSITVIHVPVTLFVSNVTGNNVVSFFDPVTLDGNVEPKTNLVGDSTQLDAPSDIVVSRVGVLIAANAASNVLTLHLGAETADGNLAPIRTTEHIQLDGPGNLAYHAETDLLFVANGGANNDILVFAGPVLDPQGFVTNLSLIHIISSAALSVPTGMMLDSSGNLYVANNGDGNILVFSFESGLDTVIEPSRVVTSASFVDLADVFVDDGDHLLVLESGGEILVFNNASSLDGTVEPDRTLTVDGAGLLSAIALDGAGTGYVLDVDRDAVYSFDNIVTLVGTNLPDRTIEGDQTNLNRPAGLFLLEE